MIQKFNNISPNVHPSVFVAPDAWIIGDVKLDEQSSVFFGVIVRGDIEPIIIGKESNIQELSVIHTSPNAPVIIGKQCTIGHRAIIHGATIGNRCLIGMGAIILDNAIIEDDSIIAAGALITEGKHIPAGSMVMGMPGKVVRRLKQEELNFLPKSAIGYTRIAQQYLIEDNLKGLND